MQAPHRNGLQFLHGQKSTMSQYFDIHPDNPQRRLVGQAVAIIRDGGVVVYPTDSCYALGCLVGDKQAMERIARIRRTDAKHNFTCLLYTSPSPRD